MKVKRMVYGIMKLHVPIYHHSDLKTTDVGIPQEIKRTAQSISLQKHFPWCGMLHSYLYTDLLVDLHRSIIFLYTFPRNHSM